ncbi:BTAD domain-containing putative transcriptional regulator [Nocardia sp. CA-119907]|uniref:AfsR/SARP family transcriptional regulator n=1 Tax=Nocardia sp. CA-119907 TaxID=3239973 RepID=UPI003D993FBC
MLDSGATASPGGRGLQRPRLLRRMANADVTVVIAPAGSGKTHLLQQYAAIGGERLAWYRADPDDVDADRFLRRLRAASENDPRTLIVDDFHFVVGGPAESAFERFAWSGGSPRVRVVLGSRVRPTINLMRAEIGRVTVLSGDDLRFRYWEVEELFAGVYGRRLPPDEAAALSRFTDGWAAGLHLFHLGTQTLGAGARRAAICALSGRARYLQGYLARTVLGELPAELCEFLRRTQVFETLTAERCDRLLGRSDSAALLAELERRQALTSSDDDGHSFRYHEVLRQHLASALREELGAAEATRWCRKAATQLEDEHAYPEAARLFARAEHWTEVARLLNTYGARVVGDPQSPVWCAGLPTSVVEQDPWLSLATARREVAAGSLRRGAERYRHAERLFSEPELRDAAARERRLVDIWLAAAPQAELHWLDRIRAASMRRPLDYVDYDIGCAGDAFAQTCALVLAGHVRRADQRAQLSVSDAADPILELWTQFVGMLAAMACGENIGTRIEQLAGEAERLGATVVMRQCRVLSQLGAASKILAECDAAGDQWGAVLAAAVAAYGALVAGESSMPLWQAVAERCARLRADTPMAWALAFEALAAAAEGAGAAESKATRAEAFARTTGVPGARAIALLANAARTDIVAAAPFAAARALAAEIGMPLPQTLLDRVRDAEPAANPAVVLPISYDAVLRLRCLGAFVIEVDGTELDPRTLRPRAAATLRYLSMRAGQWVHRDDLAAALWPDLPATQARQSLQVSVSAVRGFLEPGTGRGKWTLLMRRGETYSLVLQGRSAADVVAFETSLETARCALQVGDEDRAHSALTTALAEYRGELLPADGAAEWVVAERDRLRTQASLAGVTLAEFELGRGRAAAAIDALRRSLGIDPYLDRAWRLLISAYQRADDLAAAERARRDYAKMLAELGVHTTNSVTVLAGPVRTGYAPGTSPRPRVRSAAG